MDSTINCAVIVDDDSISNYLTAKVIKKSKIANHVYSFQNADEALEFIQQYSQGRNCAPELIIVDINMPGTSGFDFLEELKDRPFKNIEEVVVVGLSAEVVPVNKRIRHTFTKTFVKPFRQEHSLFLKENYFGNAQVII